MLAEAAAPSLKEPSFYFLRGRILLSALVFTLSHGGDSRISLPSSAVMQPLASQAALLFCIIFLTASLLSTLLRLKCFPNSPTFWLIYRYMGLDGHLSQGLSLTFQWDCWCEWNTLSVPGTILRNLCNYYNYANKQILAWREGDRGTESCDVLGELNTELHFTVLPHVKMTDWPR